MTFLSLARDPERSLAWHTLFMVVTTVIVSYGFRDGIERACRQLLPAVLVLSVLLLALAMIGSDIGAVWHQMTMPDLGRLGWRGALEALYQAFFTLGLGLGAMMMLGGYLPSDVNLVRLAGAVAVMTNPTAAASVAAPSIVAATATAITITITAATAIAIAIATMPSAPSSVSERNTTGRCES